MQFADFLSNVIHRFERHAAVSLASALALTLSAAHAAPADRITRRVNPRQLRTVPGAVHRLARAEYDRGAVDPAMRMDYMLLLTRPTAAQQAALDQLLADQQNPASPSYHHWLSPEEFGDRFGLSDADCARVTGWLESEGFDVDRVARGRNWFAFSGSAGQVEKSLHTQLHRFLVEGEPHFANTSDPSVPDALADVVGAFVGLNDFKLKSLARPLDPAYNVGSSHFIVPEDWATIYNVNPLYQSGIDGSGQNIAVVGQSSVLLSDIRAFRARYGLPDNDPKLIPYSGVDPGFNGAQIEGNLDLEWAGAIAPKATIYYVYGSDPFIAVAAAIDMNVAPVISISYGFCELDFALPAYRSFAQQGNAQGITMLAASGDTGAAGCDFNVSHPFATQGRGVQFPSVLPEITAVGGTQFTEGTGSYWATSNTPAFGSALSYIPEAAWNESDSAGLGSGGGGRSNFISKPGWQTGPGVPADQVRDVPDISASAAGHDAYYITLQGANGGVAGTSASAPSMAGVVALLNQYLVTSGAQKRPGLGNINPQLYRLAQIAPTAFHDITAGDIVVPCWQGTPDCLTGTFGFEAATGYDLATGLGSIDAHELVTRWATQTNGVDMTLFLDATRITLNDTVGATAIITPTSGKGTPTGIVEFSIEGLPVGSIPVITRNGQQVADVFFPVYRVGTGAVTLTAVYSGDTAFSSGGATKSLQIVSGAGTGAAAIIPSGPTVVWANPPDGQGLSWQTTLTLREAAGVPAMITGFTIDGVAQPLSAYFPSPNILPNGTLSADVVFRNLVAPVTRTFGFRGVDFNGNTWTREVAVNYWGVPAIADFNFTAAPTVVTQDTTADPSCQWAVHLNIDEMSGYLNVISALLVDNIDRSTSIPAVFGARRVDAYNSVQGQLCFGDITPPVTKVIHVTLGSSIATLSHEVTVTLAPPPASPTKISASPAVVNLAAANDKQPAQATLTVDLADKTQQWTATVSPPNVTTTWLTVSKLAGTGTGQIVLSANGAGFGPGVHRANLILQSPNAVPQSVLVPVVFVMGGSASGPSITSVGNAASYQSTGSPGMMLSVFGKNLAGSTETATASPLPYSLAGVTAAINGVSAPLMYVSPGQVNIQIPYSVGAGPAVLGINDHGQVAGFQFQMAPAAPGIFADADGNLAVPSAPSPGDFATLYLTGAGEVSPALKTAYFAPASAAANPYRPLLPVSLTVGGVPAFVRFVGLAPGQIGVLQINFIVPATVPSGVQPVVVTINGVPSPPVKLTVK